MAAWRNRHKHFFARVMTPPELLAEAPRIIGNRWRSGKLPSAISGLPPISK
jgi:hypothetical protein